MKKRNNTFLKSLAVVALMLLTAAGAARALPFDKYSINREDLPQAAREMLDEHFPKAKVSMVKTDKHLLKKTDYDVKLTNGTKIEFNNKGAWTSVDCGNKAIPESLLKKPMLRYVSKNYPDAKIVSIRKNTLAYELRLDSGHQLKFTLLGTHSSTTPPPAAE